MRSFTLVQNLLTALVVPFLALIVGLSSLPGIYILFKIMDFFGTSASTFNQIDSVPLEDFVVVGIGLGMGITAWGVTLVISSGLLGGLFRPRLEPGLSLIHI